MVKTGLAAQFRQRLSLLKMWESSLGKRPESITVEHRLCRIVQHAGVRNRNLFFGSVGHLEWAFGSNGLTALNDLLIRIEEDLPWKIDWYRVYQGK